MNEQAQDGIKPMAEQITYADILSVGAWTGIALMIITYLLYIGGVVSPHIDFSLVTQNWDKSVDDFLSITNAPQGWGWVALLGKGDYLNFIGIVLLSGLTIFCYLFLIAGYKKRKDTMYFIIAVLEVLVLCLAASGILGSGGH